MAVDTVTTWLPVRATLLEWQRISKALRELELSFDVDEASGTQHGDALWGTPSRGALVALGWRWREVQANVVAMENPMNISSNVVLLDELGQELSPSGRILHLNNAVYRLGWQRPILDGAKRRRQPLAA